MKSQIPNILPAFLRDEEVAVEFEYDPGEQQWFDARAGVGSPGYGPYLEIIAVRRNGAEIDLTPDDFKTIETQIEQKIIEIESEQYPDSPEY